MLCVRLPHVPTIVSVYAPGGVAGSTLTVTIEVSEVGDEIPSGVGVKDAVAPLGRPPMLRPTWPTNPPLGVTVAAYAVEPPGLTICRESAVLREKSPTLAGGGGG